MAAKFERRQRLVGRVVDRAYGWLPYSVLLRIERRRLAASEWWCERRLGEQSYLTGPEKCGGCGYDWDGCNC